MHLNDNKGQLNENNISQLACDFEGIHFMVVLPHPKSTKF